MGIQKTSHPWHEAWSCQEGTKACKVHVHAPLVGGRAVGTMCLGACMGLGITVEHLC